MDIPKQTHDLVEIIWDDATALSGWSSGGDELKPCLIRSVGYLVQQDKKRVVIAMDIANDGMQCGRGQIPRGMIQKIKVLKKKDAGS